MERNRIVFWFSLSLSLGIIIPGAAKKTKGGRERRFFVGAGDEHKQRKGGFTEVSSSKRFFTFSPDGF